MNSIVHIARESSPLVSFVLLTYNQEKFVEEAVRSALLQTYQPLEIIVSDDASTDRTFEISKSLIDQYRGPHLVTGRANAQNMGINKHLNLAVRQSTGEFIVVAAGDDISLPDRVEKLVRRWQAGVSGVFSNATIIDAHGVQRKIFVRPGYRHMTDWREMAVAGTHGAWGCTLSWERRVFECFGDMPDNIVGEDAVIPFRCGLLKGLSYIDEPLVKYRDHGENISFWAQEKLLQQDEVIDLGSRIMRFKKQMYENWQSDIEVAKNEGIIDSQSYAWGQFVLAENILLVKKMDCLLRVAFFRLFYLVPFAWLYFAKRMCSAISPLAALSKIGWKLLNGVLHYRAPVLHKFIRRFLGRNT